MSGTKVYYNSACPVCDAGIALQKKKLGEEAKDIEWIDVHNSNEAVEEIGADLEFVRERLHVVDEDGIVHVGSEAFAELWHKTPGQRFMGRIVRTPGVRQISWATYNVFARLLDWWNRQKKRW
jgi:predicted DCC family thiol-disulfide oxidoreductase YuxK